jgi:SseB protein N-terminal domain
MGFFKKLFKPSHKKENLKPDNTKLLTLIEQYISDNEYESYKKVVFELEDGNSYLLIPSENSLGDEFSSWTPSPSGLKIKIGIWFKDGLKATAAFTSEQTLFEWAKKPTKYVSFRSQMVLELCKANDIERIVIDSRQRSMIVLQKNDSA